MEITLNLYAPSIRRRALTAAEEALNQGEASLQSFAQTLLARSQAQVYDLTPHERSLYLNMNTPSDLPPGR